jgi:hypothetical protein
MDSGGLEAADGGGQDFFVCAVEGAPERAKQGRMPGVDARLAAPDSDRRR